MIDVIATALEGRVRRFICGDCGEERETLRLTGRLPERCAACDPTAMTWVRERTDREQRAAIVALHCQVEDLQQSLKAAGSAHQYARGRKYGPPGRETVARAARRVALASGAVGTREALMDLAAAAQAWAWVLGAKDDR